MLRAHTVKTLLTRSAGEKAGRRSKIEIIIRIVQFLIKTQVHWESLNIQSSTSIMLTDHAGNKLYVGMSLSCTSRLLHSGL